MNKEEEILDSYLNTNEFLKLKEKYHIKSLVLNAMREFANLEVQKTMPKGANDILINFTDRIFKSFDGFLIEKQKELDHYRIQSKVSNRKIYAMERLLEEHYSYKLIVQSALKEFLVEYYKKNPSVR
jgi:hypothetical protein